MKKSLAEWEREKNTMLNGDVDLEAQLSEEEFAELCDKQGYTGVSHEDRVAFLKANKYPVTRENMTNPNLSARTKKELKDASV